MHEQVKSIKARVVTVHPSIPNQWLNTCSLFLPHKYDPWNRVKLYLVLLEDRIARLGRDVDANYWYDLTLVLQTQCYEVLKDTFSLTAVVALAVTDSHNQQLILLLEPMNDIVFRILEFTVPNLVRLVEGGFELREWQALLYKELVSMVSLAANLSLKQRLHPVQEVLRYS